MVSVLMTSVVKICLNDTIFKNILSSYTDVTKLAVSGAGGGGRLLGYVYVKEGYILPVPTQNRKIKKKKNHRDRNLGTVSHLLGVLRVNYDHFLYRLIKVTSSVPHSILHH
jgi:hypothetical protein